PDRLLRSAVPDELRAEPSKGAEIAEERAERGGGFRDQVRARDLVAPRLRERVELEGRVALDPARPAHDDLATRDVGVPATDDAHPPPALLVTIHHPREARGEATVALLHRRQIGLDHLLDACGLRRREIGERHAVLREDPRVLVSEPSVDPRARGIERADGGPFRARPSQDGAPTPRRAGRAPPFLA